MDFEFKEQKYAYQKNDNCVVLKRSKIDRYKRKCSNCGYEYNMISPVMVKPVIKKSLNGELSNIDVLERQVADMKRKISKCVPSCLVVYFVLSFATMLVSSVLFVIKYFYGVYITKDFYLISAFLVSSTLFFTALVAMFDWKGKNTNDAKQKR